MHNKYSASLYTLCRVPVDTTRLYMYADTLCTTRRYNEIIHGAHVYLMMGVTEHGFNQVCYVKLFSVFQLQSTQDLTFKAIDLVSSW